MQNNFIGTFLFQFTEVNKKKKNTPHISFSMSGINVDVPNLFLDISFFGYFKFIFWIFLLQVVRARRHAGVAADPAMPSRMVEATLYSSHIQIHSIIFHNTYQS